MTNHSKDLKTENFEIETLHEREIRDLTTETIFQGLCFGKLFLF